MVDVYQVVRGSRITKACHDSLAKLLPEAVHRHSKVDEDFLVRRSTIWRPSTGERDKHVFILRRDVPVRGSQLRLDTTASFDTVRLQLRHERLATIAVTRITRSDI
ncbi:hypothetical protein L1080_033135 [Rhodococcus sp. MSC1_016]|jgi:hypothetical protein|uniref:hypothetical protein n=1 Tax=Rhodococcus sp. MSC1_016 TaxID=2909266 RepID=UPI00202DFBE5|nr:hypothetical protein [Rhodococcus sp. MSC1_016]